MKPEPLVALDLGSTKVACAVGLPHEHSKGFELLGASVVPYPNVQEPWLGDPLLAGRCVERALEAAAAGGDCQRAFVVINPPSLAAQRAVSGLALADEPVRVRAQDLHRLQAAAVQPVLGIDRELLLVERLGCSGNGFDGVRDPRGLSATKLQGTFHVLMIPEAACRAVILSVESAGLEVAQVGYALPAALAGMGDSGLFHKRVLVIDVGGQSTDVGVFVDGVLTTVAVVPWGGSRLATDIATELKATMDQALAWSLEGSRCRKPEVTALIERGWTLLQEAIERVIGSAPKPDAALACGRGTLMDGFVEWVERTTDIPTTIGRSPRTSSLGDLARQVSLNTAVGVLEQLTAIADAPVWRSDRVVDRLIGRTKTILAEYF